MSDRLQRYAVLVTALALTVLVGWGSLHSHATSGGTSTFIVGAIVAWAFVLGGLLAWSRRPDNATGKLMCLVGMGWIFSGTADSPYDVVYTMGLAVGSLWAAALIHLLLAYPTGRLDRQTRVIAFLGYLDTVGISLLVLPFSDPVRAGDAAAGSAENVALVHYSRTIERGADVATLVFGIVLLAWTVAVLLRRWRRATPAARYILTPVYATGAAVIVAIGVLATISLNTSTTTWVFYVFAAVFLTVPLGFVAGILRMRLSSGGTVASLVAELERSPDPDSTRAALRTALNDPTLGIAFRLSDGGWVDVDGDPILRPAETPEHAVTEVVRGGRSVAALIHDPAVRENGALLRSVCATAGLALENQRLQAELRAQLRAVRRLAEEQAGLRRVATLVASTDDPQPVFDAVTEEVALLLEAPTANLVHYVDDTTLEVVAGWSEPDVGAVPAGITLELDGSTVAAIVRNTGRPARLDSYEGMSGELARRLRELGLKAAVAAPVYVAGGLWGAITVSSTSGPFPAGAETRIAEFNELVGLALSSAEARRALAASRARIVEAGDAERRRLERNLHDGAQQRLVSLRLGLRVARSKLATDPEAAAALLDASGEELDGALAELRDLARGIHPAILTERGLDPALRGIADRLGSALPVTLHGVPEERLPPPVEAALYYVASESLANTLRHADACCAEVRVGHTNGMVTLEVSDDGVGGASLAAGRGLRGLADRVEALSGRLAVDSPPGAGTRVRVEIPCG